MRVVALGLFKPVNVRRVDLTVSFFPLGVIVAPLALGSSSSLLIVLTLFRLGRPLRTRGVVGRGL